ncbi:hypothetical protein F4824DRAFT_454597 [Ustulina deusta]|nr:hypothetical protein F4824DRAFT_454597 [Ustulina deusta]
MRPTAFLLAASGCAHATWLRWSVNREQVWAAQETGDITESDHSGWTPIPTPAPGLRSEGEAVLDLLRRQTSETDWTNPETCGWFAGVSSSPVMCGNNFTCATNSDHVVACASATLSPFYTACLDYTAFKAGSCTSLGAATGCCQQEAEPACGTYLWTNSPQRSMYKCFETASILTILDVPQFVLDASLFSKTHTTSTPTITGSSSAADGSASPSDSAGVSNSGSNGGNSGPSGGNSGSSGSSGDSGSGHSTDNTPIIVGSVIGGVAGLLFLLLLLLCLMKRKAKGKLGLSYTRNKNNKQKDHSTHAYQTTNLTAAATKGRSSSGSETVAVVPMPAQQPQNHYYNQERHHYHPQAQIQPQIQTQIQPPQPQQQPPPQYQAGGQQPISMSYTVNEGATHTSQPSYSHTTSYTMPSNSSSSSGAPPQFVVGGLVAVPYHSNDKQQYQQPQPQFQQQSQQQQQSVPSQLQPVNHIHVYYAPPAQNAEQGISYAPSQSTTPAPDTQTRGSVGVVPDALGLYTQHQEQGYATHGPGYRQSF